MISPDQLARFGLCKADPGRPGPNYNKLHVPVEGEYDGRPRWSCLYCGRWLDD